MIAMRLRDVDVLHLLEDATTHRLEARSLSRPRRELGSAWRFPKAYRDLRRSLVRCRRRGGRFDAASMDRRLPGGSHATAHSAEHARGGERARGRAQRRARIRGRAASGPRAGARQAARRSWSSSRRGGAAPGAGSPRSWTQTLPCRRSRPGRSSASTASSHATVQALPSRCPRRCCSCSSRSPCRRRLRRVGRRLRSQPSTRRRPAAGRRRSSPGRLRVERPVVRRGRRRPGDEVAQLVEARVERRPCRAWPCRSSRCRRRARGRRTRPARC